MHDKFNTIINESEGFFKDRGSKFFAHAYHVKNEEEITLKLELLRKKYHDARHHCYAYILGADKKKFRANDDGEPGNSAGQPILGQIKSFELSDVLIVVIRYFGGTKLGVPGLINAYKTAAKEALALANIVEETVDDTMVLHFEYPLMNAVNRLIKEEVEIRLTNRIFEADCKVFISTRVSQTERIAERIRKIHGVKLKIE